MSDGMKKAKWMRTLIWLMVVLLFAIIGTCWYYYPESYEFWNETISDLGMIYSHSEGILNTTSRWIFTFGFIAIAIMLLILLIMYLTGTPFYVGRIKILVLIFFMLGAIGTAIPYDTVGFLSVFHYIGAALFVGGFGIYNFISQLLRYIRKHTPIPKKKTFDYFLDLTFVILVFIATAWYLISGLLGILDVDKLGWLSIFNTALSQKVVLFVSGTAAFLLDPDDI